MFKFDRYACLRSEYSKNECMACIDICPKNAFEIFRKKFIFKESECISCGICISSCPSEALKFTEVFNVESILGKSFLSCKTNIPCLAALHVEDLISICLYNNEAISCDISTCKECELNADGKVLKKIENNIEKASNFLQKLEKNKYIKKEKNINLTRREFFKTFKPKSEEFFIKKENTSLKRRNLLKTLLQKSYIFKDLKNIKTDIFYSKHINDKCTNCGDCVKFCPTKALMFDDEKTSILYICDRCIGCKICVDICKEDAISSKNICELLDFVDIPKVLVKHKYKKCSTCKNYFISKNGNEKCSTCKEFEKIFPDKQS